MRSGKVKVCFRMPDENQILEKDDSGEVIFAGYKEFLRRMTHEY